MNGLKDTHRLPLVRSRDSCPEPSWLAITLRQFQSVKTYHLPLTQNLKCPGLSTAAPNIAPLNQESSKSHQTLGAVLVVVLVLSILCAVLITAFIVLVKSKHRRKGRVGPVSVQGRGVSTISGRAKASAGGYIEFGFTPQSTPSTPHKPRLHPNETRV